MCGIYGVASGYELAESQKEFNVVSAHLCHRGPDGSGDWISKYSSGIRIKLGHHRLAVNDLDSRASQPLISDSGSAIIVNGEIYNSDELRHELESSFNFKTNSDSEVALAVLDIYGQQGVSKLNGMFAFAYVPKNGGEVWLGRDRLGIKPLYYSRDSANFWFSSEAHALAKALNRSIDEVALEEWSLYQFIVSDRSMFDNILPVPSGHLVIYKDERIQHKRYWNFDDFLPSNSREILDSEAVFEQTSQLLLNSVQSHLLSDVEIVTLTSGGMDSSLVSAIAAQFGVKQAFVGRYDGKEYDETEFAKMVASQSGLDLKVISIDSAAYFNELDAISSRIDFPTAGPGAIGQSIIAREISKVAKVVLSGTGGDELFLGYVRDRFPLIAAGIIDASLGRKTNLWSSVSGNMESFSGYNQMLKGFAEGRGFQSPLSGFLNTVMRTSEGGIFQISKDNSTRIESELLAKIAPNGAQTMGDIHEALLRFELKLFLPSLLHVEDRITMAHGLESRVPLLDTAFVEYVLGLPLNLRIGGQRPKDILRHISADWLPKPVLNRKDKMGFPVPLQDWIRGRAFDRAEEAFETLSASNLAIVNKRNLISPNHLVAGTPREVWAAITLSSWLKTI